MGRVKWVLLGIVAVPAVLGTGLVAARLSPFADEAPQQPIAFPHDLHAGKNHIPCMYCHYSADRSWDAGIPAVATCAGCHLPGGVPMVRADRPGVQQLTAYWQRKLPIPWVRVYNLPDYVRFPHMRHIRAGLNCQQCHGAVQTMAVVRRVVPLRMGWCVDCHRQRGARTDCTMCHY
jgi:hypothetical protein